MGATPSVRFAASFPASGEAFPARRFPIHGEAPPEAVKGFLFLLIGISLSFARTTLPTQNAFAAGSASSKAMLEFWRVSYGVKG